MMITNEHAYTTNRRARCVSTDTMVYVQFIAEGVWWTSWMSEVVDDNDIADAIEDMECEFCEFDY